MKIGLMADTHDNLRMIERAVSVFEGEGVGAVLHAGDFIAPFALRALKEALGVDLYGVFGNNDGERTGLKALLGDRLLPAPALWELGGWRVLLAHELTPEGARALAEGGALRLVAFGHTHEALVERLGETLIVNPGEAGGWLYGRPTVAVVDLRELKAEIRPLDG